MPQGTLELNLGAASGGCGGPFIVKSSFIMFGLVDHLPPGVN